MSAPAQPASNASSEPVRYRSKTIAAWLGVLLGSLGAQRFYLHGLRDPIGWLFPLPTLLGLWGAWRMDALGQDDRLSWLLVPLLGATLSIAMLSAIIAALTPDERWDQQHNPAQPPRPTGWGPVLAAIAALILGGIALIGTIAFAGQRFFEWQMEQEKPAARGG